MGDDLQALLDARHRQHARRLHRPISDDGRVVRPGGLPHERVLGGRLYLHRQHVEQAGGYAAQRDRVFGELLGDDRRAGRRQRLLPILADHLRRGTGTHAFEADALTVKPAT